MLLRNRFDCCIIEIVTILTVLRTSRACPCFVRAAASTNYFRLRETEVVAQTGIGFTAAGACPVAGGGRVTRGVAKGYRAVGIVARRRFSHCLVSETRKKEYG